MWVVALALGCFGGDDAPDPKTPPPDTTGPLNVLADAPATPLMQQVWFEAAPGELVEGVATSRGADVRPLVTLVDRLGRRRTMRLDAPGVAVALDHVVADESRGSLTDTAPDGRSRVVLEPGRIQFTDTMGGGSRDLVRDPGRRFLHPSFASDSRSVYVGEVGELGGIWQIGVDGTARRVVPEREASTPVAFRLGDRDVVAWIEERAGEAPRVVVGSAPVEAQPASSALGALPTQFWPAVQTTTGVVRARPCDDKPGLSWTMGADGARVEGVLGTTLTLAWSCGPGCVQVGAPSPGGAPRLLGTVKQEGPIWRWDLGVHTPIQVWVAAPLSPDMPAVDACRPVVPDGIWLQTPRWVGGEKADLHGVEVRDDRVAAHGTRMGGRQPFLVHIPHTDQAVRAQTTNKPVEVDPLTATSPDGKRVVAVEAGAVVWRQGGSGVAVPASPDRSPIGVALSPDARAVYIADGDDSPGLDRVDLASGRVDRVARGPVRLPGAYLKDGIEHAVWVEAIDGRPAVIDARPPTAAEHAAWEAGPTAALAVYLDWVPVQVEEGRPVRCAGPYDVHIGVKDGRAVVRIGEVATPIHGAVADADSSLRLLGVAPSGDPRIVAEGRLDKGIPAVGDGLKWIDRYAGTERMPGPPTWFPAERAQALPQGGPCRQFGD